jgi:transcriptional regulator with XRE-family HTH domain
VYIKNKKLPTLGKEVMEMNHDVAENLKRIREEKKLTQEQMAVLLGYSVSGYRKIENGNRGLPIHKAMKAAKILGCSLNEIFLP